MRKKSMASIRQMKIAREEAVDALRNFLVLLAPDMLSRTASEMRLAHDSYRAGKAWNLPELSLDVQLFFASTEILYRVQEGKSPRSEDLEVLKLALNHEVSSVSYSRRGRYSKGAVRHWEFQSDPIREAAEELRRYLTLCEVCGPVHRFCARDGCMRPVIGGRGNKRFCSDDCRKEHWSYGNKTAYYLERQRANRQVRNKVSKKSRNRRRHELRTTR